MQIESVQPTTDNVLALKMLNGEPLLPQEYHCIIRVSCRKYDFEFTRNIYHNIVFEFSK